MRARDYDAMGHPVPAERLSAAYKVAKEMGLGTEAAMHAVGLIADAIERDDPERALKGAGITGLLDLTGRYRLLATLFCAPVASTPDVADPGCTGHMPTWASTRQTRHANPRTGERNAMTDELSDDWINDKLDKLQDGDSNDDEIDTLREIVRGLQEQRRLVYKAGFLDGLWAYAWMKEGVFYVGSTGRTYEDAIADVEQTWNYDWRYRHGPRRVL